MTAYDKAAKGRRQKLRESPLRGLMQEENVWRTVEQLAHGPEVVIGRAPTGATRLAHYAGHAGDTQSVKLGLCAVQQSRGLGREVVMVAGNSGKSSSGSSHPGEYEVYCSEAAALGGRRGAIKISR